MSEELLDIPKEFDIVESGYDGRSPWRTILRPPPLLPPLLRPRDDVELVDEGESVRS